MIDREKIIAKLEKEVKRTYAIKTTLFDGTEKVGEEITIEREPYVTLTVEMADKILALLQEQEHKDKMHHALDEDWKRIQELMKEDDAKCLTKEELDDLAENQFVWIEERTGYLYCLQIIGICRGRTGVSDIQFNALTSYVERSTNTYGKSYRIWTDKPTEEQSQAVKWE